MNPERIIKNPLKSFNWFLYFAAAVVNIMGFLAGICFAWSSPVLPKLNGSVNPEGNPLGTPITKLEGSWIAACVSLGGLLGPLVAGRLANRIGRKKSLLLAVVPMGGAFLIGAFAKEISLFYLLTILMGIAVGCIFTIIPMYLGEIAEIHNRGTLGTLLDVFKTMGVLFTNAVGPFLTIQNFCLVCLIPLLIFLVFVIWVPESPHYLASIKDYTRMKMSLTKLRIQSSKKIDEEMLLIIKYIEEQKQTQRHIRDLFKRGAARKGLKIIIMLVLLQQFSGFGFIGSYLQTIFVETGSKIRPDISAIIVSTFQVGVTIITSSLVDRLGRRILLITSSLFSGISLVCLGAYFYMKSENYNVDSIYWFPLFSLVVHICSFYVGLGPIPWAVLGELFAPNVKANASTFASCLRFLSSFIVIVVTPSVVVLLGNAQTFWIFAAVSVLGAALIYWVLPETKGRSLQQIQELLSDNI